MVIAKRPTLDKQPTTKQKVKLYASIIRKKVTMPTTAIRYQKKSEDKKIFEKVKQAQKKMSLIAKKQEQE